MLERVWDVGGGISLWSSEKSDTYLLGAHVGVVEEL